MVLYLSTISLLLSHCLWVHPRFLWSRKDVGSPKSTSLLSTFHIGARFVSFQPILSSTYTDKNNPFSRCTKRHSQLETFSQPCLNRIFSNYLSHNSPFKGWPYRFRSRGTTGSSILDHDLGHLCFGRRIQISEHSDFGIFHLPVLNILEAWMWCPWLLRLSFGRWRSLFSKYCVWSGIILHNVTSEHDSAFVLLQFWF